MSFSHAGLSSIRPRAAGAAACAALALWAHAALAAPEVVALTVGVGSDSLVSVNAQTGAATILGSGLPTGLTNYSYALNSASGLYYYQAGGSLNVVNATTGALVNSYSLSTSLYGMDYDSATGALLGLSIGSSTDALVSINTATGAVTTIGSGTLPFGLTNFAYSLNPANGDFFYQAGGKLNVVNVATGALLGSYTLTTTLDNLAFDSTTGALLALIYNGSGNDQLVSINPANGTITALGAANLPDILTDFASVYDTATGQFIYDSTGQIVTVNATTGTVESQEAIANGYNLFGFGIPGTTAVPEPPGFAILLSSLATLGLLRSGPRFLPRLRYRVT